MGRKKKHLLEFKQRQEMRFANMMLIERGGLPFTEHNGGSHLILSVNGRRYDLWPSTDKWMAAGRVRIGIPALLDRLSLEKSGA